MVFIEAAPSGENQTINEASRKNLYYKNKCRITCEEAQEIASEIYDGVSIQTLRWCLNPNSVMVLASKIYDGA
jgi:hypothetical protein